jgi:hypothetical protein
MATNQNYYTYLKEGSMGDNYFKKLYDIDVKDKVKKKNNLSYVSWAAAWAEVKKVFPDATYIIYENESSRPWFDDGRTGWVKTSVTVEGITHTEYLPIMDFKNKSILAETITSMDANKAIQRSLTKACARHGLGLYIYEGEDIPEESKTVTKLQTECMNLIKSRSAMSDAAKVKVAEVCKEADENANGDPRLIYDSTILEKLKTQLLAIRK